MIRTRLRNGTFGSHLYQPGPAGQLLLQEGVAETGRCDSVVGFPYVPALLQDLVGLLQISPAAPPLVEPDELHEHPLHLGTPPLSADCF